MKIHLPFLSCAALSILLTTLSAHAEDAYGNALKKGSELRASGSFQEAISVYDGAVESAANANQRALAIGNKAHIYAFNLKDYATARTLALKALSIPEIQPIAKVTGLEVLAECQMKDEKDYDAAITSLKEAIALPDVDWSKPNLTLRLGDAYRFSGQHQLALDTFGILETMANANDATKAVAFLNRGTIYQYALSDSASARREYDKARQFDPNLKNVIEGHQAKL